MGHNPLFRCGSRIYPIQMRGIRCNQRIRQNHAFSCRNRIVYKISKINKHTECHSLENNDVASFVASRRCQEHQSKVKTDAKRSRTGAFWWDLGTIDRFRIRESRSADRFENATPGRDNLPLSQNSLKNTIPKEKITKNDRKSMKIQIFKNFDQNSQNSKCNAISR